MKRNVVIENLFIIFVLHSSYLLLHFLGKKNGVNLNDTISSEVQYIKDQISKLKKLPVTLPFREQKDEGNEVRTNTARLSSDLYY